MRQGFFCHNPFIKIVLASVFAIFAATTTYAYERECGTIKLFESLINKRKQPSYQAQTYIQKDADEDLEKCRTEDFYDSVYTIETPHFQINYVLTGPHATTKEFADSTAAIMEAAWNFYINKHKMHKPKGPSITHHYQQKVKSGLYPIEIIELNQIRNNLLGGCGENFGLTYPSDDNGTSQIFMENDFNVTCDYTSNQDTIFVHGDTCTYSKPSHAIRNISHDFEYSTEWVKGLRVTAFHEFYHAIQLTYISYYINATFWFEASATGFEEITNPDIDDYFRYIPSLHESMGTPLSSKFKNYGASTLLIYLYKKVSSSLDKSIWENYSKNPNKNFEYQIQNALKELKLDADSIFHDYSIRLSFSGNRTSAIPETYWINDDQSQWANARFRTNQEMKPDLKSLAYEFYRIPYKTTSPNLMDYVGKASVVIYRDGEATIYNIKNTQTLDSLSSILISSDSSTWIFSRFGDSENIPIVNNDAAPHAFPVPWKRGALCFAPLPKDKKFIEIRNRRGDLVSQEEYEGTTFCMDEDKVKSMMAPGIYRFRVGNKGKTTSFIIVY